MREDLEEALGNTKGNFQSEIKQKPSKDKLSMTVRPSYGMFRQKNRVSILNIEFPESHSARLTSFY